VAVVNIAVVEKTVGAKPINAVAEPCDFVRWVEWRQR
jgi:hypothetical protein